VITEKEFNRGIDIIEECMVDLEKGLLGDDILKITKGW
jgi:4-aminobutyrate aminotransferase